jgi:hypothetical protein
MLKRLRSLISEMIVAPSYRGFRKLSQTFYDGWTKSTGKVNLTKARNLYWNTDAATNLGSGISKRIVNSTPEFMGLPWSSTGDEFVDELLNDCIHTHWSSEVISAIRDSCRDSKAVLRLRQRPASDPLASTEEINSGYLEMIPPEEIEVFYEDFTSRKIERALVTHVVDEVKRNEDGSPLLVKGEWQIDQRTIIEEITPDSFTFWDEETREVLTEMGTMNTWGFVPIVEVFNDYDASLQGGQSDLTSVQPFICAFHDVLGQALVSHKQHAIPKAMFKVQDVQNFLLNNFPDSFEHDDMGNAIPGSFSGTVSWRGTEILFFQPEEGAEFLEARSVLGDSKTLLEFIIDCMVIASEVPRWVMMLDVGAADRVEMLAFTNKLWRKRINFTKPIQELCKMILVVNGRDPVLPKFKWDDIDPNQLVNKAQALQMVTMSLELAQERQLISDATGREYLRAFVPNMKSPEEEATDAKKNLVLTAPPNAPGGRGPQQTNGQGNTRNISGQVQG